MVHHPGCNERWGAPSALCTARARYNFELLLVFDNNPDTFRSIINILYLLHNKANYLPGIVRATACNFYIYGRQLLDKNSRACKTILRRLKISRAVANTGIASHIFRRNVLSE